MSIEKLWEFIMDPPTNGKILEGKEMFPEIFANAVREANTLYFGPSNPMNKEIAWDKMVPSFVVPEVMKEEARKIDKAMVGANVSQDQQLKKYLTEFLRRKQLVAKGHDKLFIHLPGNPEHELTEVIMEFLELYEADYKYINIP
jgi:hypothetical protein